MISREIGEIFGERVEFAHALGRRVGGDVLTDRLSRSLYATDASNYRIVPDVVLRARRMDDLFAAVETAREFGIPITPRGAGSGTAGGAVGRGLVIDASGLGGVEIDPESRTAVVECGAIQRLVDDAAARHGLTFGPDTASADRATIGGMVANNSAGARSLVYGQTRHRLAWAEMVLADGTVGRFGPGGTGEVTTSMAGLPADRAGPLAEVLSGIRRRAAPMVAERFPKILRRVDGYALDELCRPNPNLARMLCGSEGTLGVFTRFGLILDERPATRVLSVLSFPRLEDALECVPALVATGPSAVEIVDGALAMVVGRDADDLIAPDAGGVLFVEFQGDDAQTAAALVGLPDVGSFKRVDLLDGFAQRRAWRLRERALGSGLPIAEPGMPPYFVEDTAVDPSRLAEYVREIRRIVDGYDVPTVLWGHASVGCVHMQPFVNIKTEQGVRQMEALASDVLDLVMEYHGAMSGEHGNGLARSQWLERYFGPELMAEMRALKTAFDPEGRMNPGKIVDAEPMTKNLRYGPSYHRRSLPSPLHFAADQGGMAGAVERCFGAGVCRKTQGGTMCPPAMVTGDERLSTRGRANALRSVISGELPVSTLSSTEMREVMGLCIGCKACKTECPVGVDMAKLKIDWLWRVRQMQGAPLRDWAVAHLRAGSTLASPMAPLVNRALRAPVVRWILHRGGLAADRRLPELASRRFSHGARSDDRPDAVLFADCFTEFQEPEVGEAALRVLRAAGLRVGPVDAGCCGRVMLSVGFVEEARRAAQRTVRSLLPHVRAGRDVLFLEPSCASAVLDDWSFLLPDNQNAGEVAAAVRPVEVPIRERASGLALRPGGPVLVHGHCHQKALWGTGDMVDVLRAMPEAEVDELDAGCCGMAGAFGYGREHAAMSRAIAEHALLPAVRSRPEATLVVPGTSCRHQIRDLTGRRAVHPMQYLASRLAPGTA